MGWFAGVLASLTAGMQSELTPTPIVNPHACVVTNSASFVRTNLTPPARVKCEPSSLPPPLTQTQTQKKD